MEAKLQQVHEPMGQELAAALALQRSLYLYEDARQRRERLAFRQGVTPLASPRTRKVMEALRPKNDSARKLLSTA